MIPDGCEEVNRRIGYRKERPMYKKGSKDEEESPSGQMIRRTKRKRALSTLRIIIRIKIRRLIRRKIVESQKLQRLRAQGR